MINSFDRRKYAESLSKISRLNTVCIEANCPNRYECFTNNIATFMILGKICTRNCKYCNVSHGKPSAVDVDEVSRIAAAVKEMELSYVVVTCVSRDDLPDSGAGQFVQVIDKIKNQGCKVEVLVGDFNGNLDSLNKVVDAKPEVIGHNIEVVERLFPVLRPEGDYNLSLKVIKQIASKGIVSKSGLMLGFGETFSEIDAVFKDLRKAGCEILTIGQYLQPNPDCAKVEKYYSDEDFEDLKKKALSYGFKHVESGKLVRSSYHADEAFREYRG